MFQRYKLNGIVNKFLLAGDKCLYEKDWRKPSLTYSTCRPFTENKERIQNFKDTRGSRYIFQNEIDIACFEHDMAYQDLKIFSENNLLIKDLTFLKI